MSNQAIQILNHAAIQARLKRMAYEIFEAFYQESELLVIGIDERGGFLAEALVDLLAEISPLQLELIHVHLDRTEAPTIGLEIDYEIEALRDKPVLVVDDVLYSGKTLLNVVSILLQPGPKAIRTAVLIDRGHRTLPVSADMVGIELATTLHQHVAVEIDLNKRQVDAYLR